MKRILLPVLLAAVLAVPFLLRPRVAPGGGDDVLVIITPHNEAIRYEFGRAFAQWWTDRTGRRVRVDWRVVGGTADIARYLESAYQQAFRLDWTRSGKAWTPEIATAAQNPHPAATASPDAIAARAAFLRSDVSCGIDVFFGGDAYQFGREAQAGRLVECGLNRRHPDWFRDDVIPLTHGGEPFRDPEHRWYGVVLSSYGIVYNRDSLRRLGLNSPPEQWTDLGDPRLIGEVGLADPTKSGSVCEAFEAILQQQMQQRLAGRGRADPVVPEADERDAIRTGWRDGLRIIQRMAANARYFTDSSQKPPIDVAYGDCAAGLCIDFYGRQQQEAIHRRGHSDRVGYVSPIGGSAASADPIGVLRGAPHPGLAAAFVEFTLSPEGQKLWAFKPGAEGGPERYALRRMPIRRDFYEHAEWAPLRSDPGDAPYAAARPFVYHPAWTGSLFREIGFVTRVMCMDAHRELVEAWRLIATAPEPRRGVALAVLEDVSRIGYEETRGRIHDALNARDRLEEVRLGGELGAWFRAHYVRAAAIARGSR